MKTCSKCGQEQPLEEFYANPKGKDGYRTDCKRCLKDERRARYESNPQLFRDRASLYQRQQARIKPRHMPTPKPRCSECDQEMCRTSHVTKTPSRCRECRRARPTGMRTYTCERCHRAVTKTVQSGRNPRFCSHECATPRTRSNLAPHRRRYLRETAAPGLTRWHRDKLRHRLVEAHTQCAYCNQPGDTLDHILPLTRGGTNDEANLTLACRACNSSKGTQTITEWNARRWGYTEMSAA